MREIIKKVTPRNKPQCNIVKLQTTLILLLVKHKAFQQMSTDVSGDRATSWFSVVPYEY